MRNSLKRAVAFILAVVLVVTWGGIPGTDAKWTVESNAQSDGAAYPAYFYTLLPGMLESDVAGSTFDTNKWNAMGVGAITNAPGRELGDATSYARGTILDKDGHIIQAPAYDSYLPIWFNGKLYTYDPTGTQSGTYNTIWTRTIVSYGVNYIVIGDQGKKVVHPDLYEVDKSFNGTKPPTFHCDGIVTIRDDAYCNVKFWVLEAGASEYTLDAGRTGIVNKGTVENNIKTPSMKTKVTVDGLSYVFDGWYDAAGNKVDFAGNGIINSDKDYYGKYVLDNPVTVTAPTAEKVYDAAPLTASDVSWTGLPAGYSVTAVMTGDSAITDVGNVANNIATYTIKNASGKDVTPAFRNVTLNAGELTVYKRNVTLTSPDAARAYNGKALTNDKIVVGGQGFAAGEGAVYNVTGSQTLVGSSENTFTYTLSSNTKAENYNITTETGVLTVTDRNAEDLLKLTVKARSGMEKYDGSAHTVTGLVQDSFKIDGAEFTVEGLSAEGMGVDAGTYDVVISGTPVVRDAQGNDVSAQFEVICENGILTIEKRQVVLTSADGSKIYDGSALTAEEVNVSGEGFAEGEGAAYAVTGSQTLAGSSENSFTYTLNDNTKSENYDITTVYGTLTVEPVDEVTVTVTEHSGSYVYDGSEKSVSGYEVSVSNPLYTTADFIFSGNAEVKGTDAGTYEMELKAEDFVNTNPNFAKVTFVIVDGSLTISAADSVEVTILGAKDTAVYDGSAHSAEGYTVSINNALYSENDFVFTGDAQVSGTDAGVYTMGLSAEDFINTNPNFKEVVFTVVDGGLEIGRRAVTLTSASASKSYDGSALTAEEVTVGGEDFAEGEGAAYTVTGSQTLVGSSENTFTYTLNENTKAENYDITTVNGTLTVTDRGEGERYQIIVEAMDETVKYDGSEKTAGTLQETAFDINGMVYTVEGLSAKGTGVNAGDYEIAVMGTPVVKDAAGNDVSAQFEVIRESGILSIEKRQVVLTSADSSKVYDGSALTAEEVNISGEGFAEGEGAEYTVTGSQTLAGSSENTFTYTLMDNTKAENYDITVVYGSLTIADRGEGERYQITVEAKDATVNYDGKTQYVRGLKERKFNVNGLIYTVEGLSAEGMGVDAGTYDVVISGTPVVRDAQGNDVSAQFEVICENGILTIEKRQVVLTSADGSKIYDGSALTAEEVNVSGEGFAEGEGAAYAVTGSQTLAGSSENSFTYTLNDNTKSENYDITTVYGTLTVEPVDEVTVTVTEHSGSYVYDGSEKSVSGYEVSVSNPLYTTADFIFSGNAEVKGTDAGTYEMELKAEDFVNTNPNFAKVTFVIVDGSLTISAADSVEVTILGAKDTAVYDGSAHSAEGYTVSINNALYSENDFVFTGDAQVSGTDAGVYTMGLSAEDFINTNPNFKEVVFTVVDGGLEIGRRAVTLTSASASKSYDGSALTAEEVTVGGEDFAEGEGAAYTVTGSQTLVGSSENTFTYTLNENTKAENYDITTVNGTLTVGAADEVVVTITEHSGSYVYDGNEKSVTGYEISVTNELYTVEDFIFSGNAEVKGTAAGSYEMELQPENFVNTNSNFTKVTFIIVDGSLTIAPVENVEVTILGTKEVAVYDGLEHVAEGYNVTISNPLYMANDFVFAGDSFVSATNAGIYAMGLTEEDFTNVNPNFKNVTFTVADGELQITKRALSVTAGSSAKDYDGQPLTCETVIYDEAALVQGHQLRAMTEGSRTDAGTSANVITDLRIVDGERDVTDNYEVTVTDGLLTVTKAEEVVVTITENSGSYLYDGTEKTLQGYEITDISNPLYTAEDFRFEGNAQVSGKDAGIYEMELQASDFVNTNPNFDVRFVIEEGKLEITKRNVILASASAVKTYNGEALTQSVVAISGDGFAEGEGASYDVTGSQREVGESDNTFTYTLSEGTKADNYEFTVTYGTLEVRPIPTYLLTIHYVDTTGKTMAEDYSAAIAVGEAFNVASPVISGYTPNYSSISSDENGMPAQNLEFTVTYTANPPAPVDPTPVDPTPVDPTPVDPTPIDPTPVDPTPVDPTPVDPTPVDPTPVDPTPVDPTPVDPTPVDPTPVDPTPVDPTPEEPEEITDAVVIIDDEGKAHLVPIEDNEVPLANIHGDHACNITSFLLMLAACIILMSYTRKMKKHQEEIYELKAKLEEIQWKNRG